MRSTHWRASRQWHPAKSVKKKLMDKRFAAAVSRESIRVGVEELGVELDAHIQVCIDAIGERAGELGL